MNFWGYKASPDSQNGWANYKKNRCETCGKPINPGFKKCYRCQYGPGLVGKPITVKTEAKLPLDKRQDPL